MALRATKDTFAFEAVSPDTEVRRLIRAGTEVPANFRLENASDAEVLPDPGPAGYPHEYTVGKGGMAHEYKRPAGYAEMKVGELRAAAASRGLDVADDAKKADLVKALKEDDG